MTTYQIRSILLFLLAVIFSIGLIFASIEFPSIADKWMQNTFHFPGFDQESSTFHISKSELYFKHFHLRQIGYISLVILLALIITGLITNKLKLSVLGAIALFIPIFGHFTVTMFFLAGLGFLRFLWIPFTEISPVFMHLGDILILPYQWLISIGNWLGVDLHLAVPVFFISAGILIFVFGVFAWFNTKFNSGKVVRSKIYKISRHPQYLGWVIWSYGVYFLPVDAQKRSWSYPDSMPLLLTIMIIILISFLEEFRMGKKYGDDYQSFKAKTAFMLPMPEWLKKFLKHPLRIFYGNDKFDSRGKAVLITLYYTVLLMLGSYLYLGFTQPAYANKLYIHKHQKKIDEYILTLDESDNRRQKDIAAMNLANYGNLAIDPLMNLMVNSDPITNTFVARTLGEIGNDRSCSSIYDAFQKSKIEMSYEMIMAIGKLKCSSFEDIMLQEISNPESKVKSHAAWYLGQIKSGNSVELLINNYSRQGKFTRMSYLEALGNIGDNKAIPLLINQLQSEDIQIVEASIIALSKLKAVEAIDPLKTFPLRFTNWEIRIYADEAIKQIIN